MADIVHVNKFICLVRPKNYMSIFYYVQKGFFTMYVFNAYTLTIRYKGMHCRHLWGAVLELIPYLWISIIHFMISINEFWISINHFWISINHFWISINHFWISINHFWISINQLNIGYP